MSRPDERWLDELDRQLLDPWVIDDPSVGTLQLHHRAHTLRQMRGAGRERVLRALMREVAGLAEMYPRRFDLAALARAYGDDGVVSRDSEATIKCEIPLPPVRAIARA